jgi:hypothetical protein
METLSILLGSGVIAAVVSAVITLHLGERHILIENITKERAKWREIMRKISDEINKSVLTADQDGRGKHIVSNDIRRYCEQLRVRLNPYPEDCDKFILLVLGRLCDSLEKGESESVKKYLAEFNGRMAFLLKHDWDRAKYEASAWWGKYKFFILWRKPEPKRREYIPMVDNH